MTNAVLSNKVDNADVVLWQYDKAYNLIALIGKFGENVPKFLICEPKDNTSGEIKTFVSESKHTISWTIVRVENNKTRVDFSGYDTTKWHIETSPTLFDEAPPNDFIAKVYGANQGEEPYGSIVCSTDYCIGELGWFNKIAKAATQDLWDFVRDYLLPLNEHIDDDMDEFALTVWGRILGLSWPTYKDESESTERISNDFFRRILKGRFFLLNMPPTAANYNKYLNIVFPFSDSKKMVAYKPYCTNIGKVNEFVEETRRVIGWAITENEKSCTITFSGYDTSKWNLPPTIVSGNVKPRSFLAAIKSQSQESYGYCYCTSSPHVIDGGTSMPNETGRTSIDNAKFMSMGFSRPTGASDEERAIIDQNPDLIYIYPAGIRYDGGYAVSAKVIGFTGQALNNFADSFAWADDDANGGIFAGTDKANFPPTSGGAS